jgi:hypothetical protein
VFKVLTTPALGTPSNNHLDRLAAVFKGVTGEDFPYPGEEFEGKSMIADVRDGASDGRAGQPLTGFLTIQEVTSSQTPGRYSLEQTIAAHTRLATDSKHPSGDSSSPDLYRRKFSVTSEVTDGTHLAYLLPIAGDTFLMVTSKFNAFLRERPTQSSRRLYDMQMKVGLVDGTPDWDALGKLTGPDEMRVHDGGAKLLEPRAPGGFWLFEGMREAPQRFYFKDIREAKVIWDSTVETSELSDLFSDEYWTQHVNLLSPAGYEVPITDAADAKRKLFLGRVLGADAADQPALGVLGAFEASDPPEPWKTPRNMEEFIQFRIPPSFKDEPREKHESPIYWRSHVSYKPHDNQYIFRLVPAGESKYFLIATSFGIF